MKRSEAIKLIEQLAYESHGYHAIDGDKMLTALEKHFKIGYEVPIGEAFGYRFNDSEYFERMVTVMYWQPEKEEDE